MRASFRNSVSSVIALMWNAAAIYIFFLLIKNGDTEIKDTVENIVILILGYYFGSTRVMNDKLRAKTDDMEEPPKKKTEK